MVPQYFFIIFNQEQYAYLLYFEFFRSTGFYHFKSDIKILQNS